VEIDLAEFLRRTATGGWLVVNVLPAVAYDEGHIPNSINLPFSDLQQRARALLPDLARPIIIYCAAFT
jgi:rhodanese-related sulfurtransferase